MIEDPRSGLQKVLVANRGEIAVRVIQACRELGIRSIAVYSDADRQSLHVHLADEAYHIGPASPAASYMNIPRLLAVAVSSRADAIHPGYGFLAESATFARACREAGIIFVGPSPEAMEAMGGKISARLHAERTGIPVVPGESLAVEEPEQALRLAERIGYPVAIKASAGGGGRGLRVVRAAADMPAALEAARREGQAYFGDDTVFIERYVHEPRHVEVQVLCDGFGNAVTLGQRDCSVQRNHQKLIEEAPALVEPAMARAMDAAALHLVSDIGYSGAGTLEFLVDGSRFYFLEMNTRIQVEHTVTELITGVDLVQAQLRVAGGEALWFAQDGVKVRGHAIECRINAEDPSQGFAPSPGRITSYRQPTGAGVRVDSHCYTGYDIPPHYDSLIAKIVTWGEDRESARRRMLRALDETVLQGTPSTLGFHQLALQHPDFVHARATTSFINRLDLAGLLRAGRELPAVTVPPNPAVASSPLEDGARRFQVMVDGRPFMVDVSEVGGPAAGGGRKARGLKNALSNGVLRSPMHGVVLRVLVEEGSEIERGAVVCVVEAMKMENEVVATTSGIVSAVYVKGGDTVDTGAPLAVIDARAQS